MKIYDVVYHDLFKYGIITEITHSYCTAFFEKNAKKMIIMDEKQNPKYTEKAYDISLLKFIEKGIYKGIFKNKEEIALDEMVLNEIFLTPSPSNKIHAKYYQDSISIELSNAFLKCHCELCNSENCQHIFLTFKKYENQILKIENQMTLFIDEFYKIYQDYALSISNILVIKEYFKKIDDYGLFVSLFCKRFERIYNCINVYYILGICLMNNSQLETIILSKLKNQNQYIYNIFSKKYLLIKNYCLEQQTNTQLYIKDFHEVYILYLIYNDQFNLLLDDMYGRLKKYNIIPWDNIVLKTYLKKLAENPSFMKYHHKYAHNYKNISVSFSDIIASLDPIRQKEILSKSKNVSLIMKYKNLFTEEELLNKAYSFVCNYDNILALDLLLELAESMNGKPHFLETIMDILARMCGHISYMEQIKVKKLMDFFPHNKYLYEVFTNMTFFYGGEEDD